MENITALVQSVPWMAVGIVFIVLNVILLVLKITKKLILLALGAALLVIGVLTGVLPTPDQLLAAFAFFPK